MSATWEVRDGDALEQLRELPDESVHCCVTSPPYFGLRDYGIAGQIGLELTPDEFVARLVGVFREVHRVLRPDGTLWLNIGDSYAGSWGAQSRPDMPERGLSKNQIDAHPKRTLTGSIPAGSSYKAKDLLGIPWLLAFALRADGWYLRSDIIWSKPNPMPESVTDRPTSAHEHLFLLAKSARYFYDADAIREDFADERMGNPGPSKAGDNPDRNDGGIANAGAGWVGGAKLGGRNKRSVWQVSTLPFPGAHFATFPPRLVEPCILAGAASEVCAECGAPRARITERYATGRVQKMADGWDTGEGGHGTIHRNGRQAGEAGVPVMATRTVGWKPSCEHDAGSAAAVVLDPFAGAATTGLVALRHGRSFIGIELNPAYAEMARERIRGDAPLLNTPAEAAA